MKRRNGADRLGKARRDRRQEGVEEEDANRKRGEKGGEDEDQVRRERG